MRSSLPARLRAVTGDEPWVPLLLVFGLNAVDELDRQAFFTLLPEIRDWFGVSLTTVLAAAAVSAFFAFVFAVPVGFLADRFNRVRLLSGGAALWAAFSFATGLAPSLAVLFAVRFGSGATKSFEPAQSSLLADTYPPTARAGVFALFRSADSVGRFFGPLLAGFLASAFFWQLPFFLFAIPSLVLAVALVVKVRDPARGGQERRAAGVADEIDAAEAPPSFGESWRLASNVRTLRRIWFALPFLAAAAQAVPPLLSIYFDEVFDLGPGARGTLTALNEPFLVLGLLVGGAATTRFLGRRPGRAMAYSGLMLLVSALSIALFAIAPFLWLAVPLGYVNFFAVAILYPATTAVVTLVVPPRARSFALGVGAMFALPGLLIAPVVGAVAEAHGIRMGLLLVAPILVCGAAVLASAAGGVEPDMRQAQAAAVAMQRAGAGDDASGALLVCRDLDVHYGQVQILFNVDFEVREGEIVALLGTNGAGKSTLLRAISGLTPPSNGAIVFGGDDITYLPASEHAARGIVQVPGGRGVFPSLTVRENLRLAAWLHRGDREYVDAATDTVFGYFPILRDRLEQAAGNLSGGEQQMLALGQAFLSRPRLLMIDELSLGLAPAVVTQLLDIVRAIHANGTTVILVEQSVNVALTIADRAVFMEKGEVQFTGPAAELLSRHDILRSVFLRGSTAAGRSAYAGRRRFGGPASPAGDGAALEVTGLRKRFGGIAAVDDVDLSLGEGQIIGLIGPNGAGKTTLFDLITGFVEPDGGSIRLFGEEITDLGPDGRSRLGLHRSFQDARLFPSLTVSENIAVALEKHHEARSATMAALRLPNVRRAEDRIAERAERLIRLMSLGTFRDKFVRELSTGTRRIVDLACVLASDPKVLLLDEPSSGIAQRETEELGPLLQRIKFETGCSVLIIEHDMPLISSVADELVALATGRVIARGAPDDVLAHPEVVASYLGTSDDAIQRSGATT